MSKTVHFVRRCGREIKKHPLAALLPVIVFAAILVTWQIAFAQAPVPNPLKPMASGGNPIFAPVPGVDITQNGPAASIHGDPGRGRGVFAQNCTTCHGDRGTDGIPNPGSDDGSVPLLNPLDPGFLEDAQASSDVPSAFAQAIDLFIQHGSRPSGDDPLYSMIGWGDHKLLTPQQLADVEAYVMQLNGVYWGDRFYPPAEVRMQAVSDTKMVTYTITIVNHGSSPLGDITLRDTLPPGLTPVKAAIMGFDQSSDPSDPTDQGNNGQMDANNVQFVGSPNVPVGGTLGPFIILARITDPRIQIAPNVAQLLFSYQTYDGTTNMSSAVSDPVAPKPAAAATAAPAKPAVPSATATATPATTASAPKPTVSPTAAGTLAPGSGSPTAQATPAATATSSAANPPASTGTVQIVEPNPGALSWGYDPQTITIKVGGQVTWTNKGSMGHTVTADDGSFDSGILNPGDTWSFTFTKAGTYAYHCAPHPWMKATVVVQ